jgi:hypothetical protein
MWVTFGNNIHWSFFWKYKIDIIILSISSLDTEKLRIAEMFRVKMLNRVSGTDTTWQHLVTCILTENKRSL